MRSALVAAVGLGLLATSCRAPDSGSDRAPFPPGTPIVLVSIDTLRSDHLPAYGYRGVATPAIDALRADGVLYERAWSHTPLTLPSHTSLFTGLLPGDHGVRDNVGYQLDRARVEAGEIPDLPLALKRRGYATGAGVSAFVLQGKSGLATGFDLYDDAIELRTGAGLGGLQRPGGETLQKVVPWLRAHAAGPLFLFLHLYEPHTPYEPPERFRGAASPYDGEIAAADAVVGDLVAELRALDLYDRALVVLLSDHGEGLGEHGEEEHGLLLHREALQVPLLLKLPGRRHAGRSVAEPVGLVDVAPTIYALAGLEPSPAFAGRSLLAALDAPPDAPVAAPRAIYSETFYPRLHFGWSELASLIDDRFHLIDGPAPELYDLGVDPGERTNRLDAERRDFARLRALAAGFRRELVPPAAIDEATREAMAGLGYLGSTVAGANGPLPDPKSQLPTLAKLKAGFGEMHEKRWADAERTFAGLVAANPQMVDAWEFLGRARTQLGRLEEALAAYQEALRRSGGAPHVAQNVASILFDLERFDDAAEHAKLTLATAPSFAHGLMARIALRQGELDDAEREAKAAMEGATDRILPRLALAEVVQARGRHEEALALLAETRALYAARSAPEPELLQGLNLLEGRALADLGRPAEAERAFREEIRLFPADPKAYANLALLLALTGRAPEAAETMRAMTAASPTPAAYAEAVKTYRALGDATGAATVLRFARKKFPGSELLRALEAVS